MTPFVSVIIPVYNVAPYLRQCLDSVINQTLEDIEIICIDDGSSDGSLHILNEYAANDNRIIVLKQENLGAGAARNKGLKIAKGRYLSFLDADDFFELNMLRDAYIISQENNLDIILFDAIFFDNQTGEVENSEWFLKRYMIPIGKTFNSHDVAKYIFNFNHNVAWNKLFSREFIIQNALLFQEVYHTNDTYFVTLALAKAKRLYCLDKKLIHYRRNVKTSLSATNARQNDPLGIYKVLSAIQSSLKQNNLYDEFRQSFVSFALGHLLFNLKSTKGLSNIRLSYAINKKWLDEFDILNNDSSYFHAQWQYDELNKFLSSPPADRYFFSFDIFDTLITRITAVPQGPFAIMQNKLIHDEKYKNFPYSLRYNFYNLRMQSERFLYQKVCTNKMQDITFSEIYSYIAFNQGLSDIEKNLLMDLEISTERQTLVPVSENIQLVEQLISEGHQVILISDMYHDEELIREILCKFSQIFQSIPLYVSSKYKKKKHHGELFRFVGQQEGISYKQWIHIGDNVHSDGDTPKKLGINTQLFPYPKLMPYESLVLAESKMNANVQYLIGISRFLRIKIKNSPQKMFGVSFGACFLLPYVCWILEQASKKEISDLYFISRDGYVLKRMADIIIQNMELAIKTHYLYGSRESWRAPYDSNELDKIEKVASYIKQEVDFSKNIAFVEYAGTGLTQDCLARIIDDYNMGSFEGSYYLYHSRDCNSQYSKKFCFLPLNEKFSTIIELLVRAPHGQTLGYIQGEDRRWYPEMEDIEGDALVNYGYKEYISGIEQFTQEISTKDFFRIAEFTDPTIFYSYLEYLHNPNMDYMTADFLGGIPFTMDGKVNQLREYAPRLTLDEVSNIFPNNLNKYKGYNILISKLRSEDAVQLKIEKLTKSPSDHSNEKICENNYAKYLEKEINNLRNSLSFRIGQFVTFVPRKIRGGIRCYKEHGIRYTTQRIKEKIFGIFRR